MYLVIDVGGTFTKYAIMERDGNIIQKDRVNSHYHVLEEFQEAIAAIVEQNRSEELEGVAFSCPGTIDVQTGTIYKGGSFPFLHEFGLVKWLEDRFHIPVSIENDGKSAALAELWQGSIKGCKNALVLVLGSGVGGGLIIDGKLYRGSFFSAGEVSYITSAYDAQSQQSIFVGSECSAVRMIRNIAVLNGLDENADGRDVFSYIEKENPASWQVFSEFCRNLAIQILNLRYILDPEIISIGGGISEQPIVTKQIQAAVQELTDGNPKHMTMPSIVTARFHNDANIYGALYHFLAARR